MENPLVCQSEKVEGYDIAIRIFNIIFDDVAVGDVTDLLLSFVSTTNLECKRSYAEIRYP